MPEGKVYNFLKEAWFFIRLSLEFVLITIVGVFGFFVFVIISLVINPFRD